MKYLPAAVLMVILISGCVTLENHDCDEDKLDLIRDVIENRFELNPGDYVLNYAECKGSSTFIAKGIIDNKYSFEYYHSNVASSSPSSYQETCFSIEPADDNEYFHAARNKSCAGLESKQFCPQWNESCGIEEYDNTTETREACLNGKFDKTNMNKRIFSVRQEHHYSWVSIVSNDTNYPEICE